MDRGEQVRDGVVGQVRQRAVGAHPSGVRTAVAVGEPLVVTGERQCQRVPSVAHRDQRRLLALEPLFHDDPDVPGTRRARVEQGIERIVRLARVRAHGHALARRQPVGLHDDAVPARGDVARVCARGRDRFERPSLGNADPRRRRDIPAERLARFDPSCRLGGPERGHARSAERVGDPGRQRRLRPDHRELDGLAARQLDEGRAIERVDAWRDPDARLACYPGTARCDDHLVDARFGGQLPGQGVFAAADTHDEHPRRHHEARAHESTAGRVRIGRQARSIVWVRSGPTDTRTMGTRACSSMAVT